MGEDGEVSRWGSKKRRLKWLPRFSVLLFFGGFVMVATFYVENSLLSPYSRQHTTEERQPGDSCDALLRFGNDEKFLASAFGCRTQQFTFREAVACLQKRNQLRKIVLIGDSRTRQIHTEVVKLFNHSYTFEPKTGNHEDLEFFDTLNNVTVKFLWVAYLDEAMLRALRSLQNELPGFLVIGSAVWTIRYRNGSDSPLEEYCRNLTKFYPLLQSLAGRTSVLWILQDPVIENHLAQRRKIITNKQIETYNEAAEAIFRYSGVQLWESGRKIALHLNDSVDGLHMDSHVVRLQVQNLMNYWCNQNFPDKNLCCAR